ncbi:TMV resistance protein N-like [Ipomoea triloba]|uniref:TMV resistance protein N-like n=1 Tax=Ipomoea triloba TaxID=35885 RepID=UPI00125E228E|nr:TMV resistance protein N-like [Ipomoea triloba]
MAAVLAEKAAAFRGRCIYDVFLSFRGEDTRRTFTDQLYKALVDAGLRTFRDDNEIERGENIQSELLKGIHRAKSSIIVLSENYATSSWCLDELVVIMENRRSGHAVLPVFYQVDPSHVGKQMGSFAKAFAQHEMRFVAQNCEDGEEWAQKIKGWRCALKEVAQIGGMIFQNHTEWNESKFIQKVLKVITDKVNRTVHSIAPYLIGIRSRADDINLWVQDGSNDVDILVMYGMGGIGKTTIARFVYITNCDKFEGSSFVANVGEVSKKQNGMIMLQRNLLSDIFRRKEEQISSVDEGIRRIRAAIGSKKILLVLDNVDQPEQLNDLFGIRDWFYPGSKIIVTTRKERLLSHETCKVYKVESMLLFESLELFCLHTFGQAHPVDEYVDYSMKAVKRCDGLPLALEILGSSLAGKHLDVWESTIKKLEAIPNNRILDKLRLSYDSLQDDDDRNIFLHLACFFVGKDRDLAIAVLDSCDLHGGIGVQNLIERNLLAIDEHNKLSMHQLVQDMGREIVRQESPKEPGKRSHVWHPKDSFYVLTEKTGTERVEGIKLEMQMLEANEPAKETINMNYGKKRKLAEFLGKSEGHLSKKSQYGFFWHSRDCAEASNVLIFTSDAFLKMQRLKFLQLNSAKLIGSYEQFPKRLRWLCWHGLELESIPSDFPLESLIALDLRYNSFKQVWKGSRFLRFLKILNLSHSYKLTRTPNFLGVPSLEKLILKYSTSLTEIHETIGCLEGLVLLNVKGCKNLRRLPESMCLLKCLETLVISGCSNLDWPTNLEKIDSLKVLHADGIAMNQVVSRSGVHPWHSPYSFLWSLVGKRNICPKISHIDLPRSLVHLSLAKCNLSDDNFPIAFSNLSMLESLDLSNNLVCSLPESIKCLRGLRNLKFTLCPRLKSLIGLPHISKRLNADDCMSLEKISYQAELEEGFRMFCRGCKILAEIEGYFKLEPLENVNTDICGILGLPNLATIRNIMVKIRSRYLAKLPCLKLSPQILYQPGIFTTFLPGDCIPSWFNSKFTFTSPQSSFTLPAIENYRIQGLSFCLVYLCSDDKEAEFSVIGPSIQIDDQTKLVSWRLQPPYFGIPNGREGMMCLSHWNLGSQLQSGDFLMVLAQVVGPLRFKELGIKIWYVEEQQVNTQESSFETVSKHANPCGDVVPVEIPGQPRYFLWLESMRLKKPM